MANKQLPAFMEFGVWMVVCPVCGTHVKIDTITHTAVCTYCNPSLLAMALQPIQGGLFRPVADVLLREETRKKALEAGSVFDAAYPEEKVQIEAVLRERPAPRFMNWYYEGHLTLKRLGREQETVDDLIGENVGNGVDMAAFELPEIDKGRNKR
jgi:hypothetical protein